MFSSDRAIAGNTADNPQIFSYAVGTGTTTKLTATTGGRNDSPSPSADGSRIAFSSDRNHPGANNADGSRELFLYDTVGPTITQLTNWFVGFTSNPSISADGTRIAFDSVADLTGENGDENKEIFLHDTTTATTTQITDTTGGGQSNVEPSLSADGTRIAFYSNRNIGGGNPDGNYEVFLHQTNGGTTTQVTSSTDATGAEVPRIAADGTRIVFQSKADIGGGNPDGGTEIFLYEIAGGTTTQVTSTSGGDDNLHPTISADGTRIAYASYQDSPSGTIGRIRVHDTTGPTTTTVVSSTDGERPWISADGSLVAFSSERDLGGGNPDLNREIFLATCGPAPRPDAAIGTATTGPFKGNDVYSASATTTQTKSATVARGATRTFHVQVGNDAPFTDSLTVKGVSAGAAGYTVTYFRGSTNITAAVQAGTYELAEVPPGGSVLLKVKIKAGTTTARGSTRTATVTVRSSAATSVKDAVQARATRS